MKVLRNIKNWFINHKPTKRRIVQLYTALLYNANLKGFIKGEIFIGSSKVACVPGLNCYSCPGAIGACPLGSLQGAISNANKKTPYYVFGIILLYGIIFGRTICGWLCPVGLCQDLTYKIKSPKLQKNKITKLLSYVKYILLVVMIFILPLAYSRSGLPVPAFCKYICPAGIFEGAFFLLGNPKNESWLVMLGPIFTWKFSLFIIIFIACIFIYRAFCRFICPLGAIYSLFNKFNILGVKLNKDKCIDCGLCIKECKMDIRKVGDHECINCGDCIAVCPTQAIKWNGQKFEIPKNEIEENIEIKVDTQETENKKKTFKLITQIISCVLLVGVLIYAYFGDKKDEPPVSSIAKENEVCKDFEIFNTENEKIYSVEEGKGKITILNFWYIDCVGCIKELPEFEEFYQENKDDVNVIAINPIDTQEEIGEFLYECEWDLWGLSFGISKTEDDLPSYFSINNAYPFTAILDRDGVIKKLHSGTMNLNQLTAYYNQFK